MEGRSRAKEYQFGGDEQFRGIEAERGIPNGFVRNAHLEKNAPGTYDEKSDGDGEKNGKA